MHRIDNILRHPRFSGLLAQIEACEANRIFCRHGLAHLTDVARIAWIDVLENAYPLQKHTVYAAALLHDLGRAAQYAGLGNHDTAALAEQEQILRDAGFGAADTTDILAAIAAHGSDSDHLLSRVLYRADKLSRPCHSCSAAAECYWPDEKRNRTITV